MKKITIKKPQEKAVDIHGYMPTVSRESFVFIIVFVSFFIFVGSKMGAVNMINTMINTAYRLLLDTVFYILAITVLAGAISGLLTEFGVVALINRLLSPLMEPIYNLPGAGILGIITTYLSDNPAILSLADDYGFRSYFKKYQLPALTNLGTSFGMGMIITTYMIGLRAPDGQNYINAALIGNIGAVIGSIISVRLMLHFTKKEYGTKDYSFHNEEEAVDIRIYRKIRSGNPGARFLEAMLEGGKNGLKMGMTIIPGTLVICTLVLMMTNSPPVGGSFTGGAYEGIGFLTHIGGSLNTVLKPLFGFSSPEAISVPVTALGAAGAAISLIPSMIQRGLVKGNDIAVFTAICMCWSGYLSTHVSMMDSLKYSKMTGKAIICHTVGGLFAGIAAHWIYVLLAL